MSLVDGGSAELVLTLGVNLLPEAEPHDDIVESTDSRVVQNGGVEDAYWRARNSSGEHRGPCVAVP